MTGYQIVSEALIFNQDDLLYKLDDWTSGKSKILLVFGLMGSGKSTTGKEMAKKYNADYKSTDHDISGDSFKPLGQVDSYGNKVIRQEFNRAKKPVVWEGVHLYFWLTPKEISMYPTIVKGTSHLVSSLRSVKRGRRDISKWKEFYWALLDNKLLSSKHNELVKYLKGKK